MRTAEQAQNPEEVIPVNNPHSTRQQCRADVCRWVAWHAAELAALGLPAVLAVTVSVWFWALVAVAGVGWAVHETRQQRRRRRALGTGRRSQQVTDTTTASTSETTTSPTGPTREHA